MEHQNYPLPALLTQLSATPEQVFSFDVALVLENTQDVGYLASTHAEVLFVFHDQETSLHGEIRYHSTLFRQETMIHIRNHFLRIFDAVLKNADQPIADIDLVTEEEHALLRQFNQTSLDFLRETTLIALFNEQVEKTPDALAVTDEHQSLTYKQLQVEIEKIASALLQRGVTSNCVVGLLVDRSIHTVVSIFGILKAGAAYLPINRQLPSHRIQFMLEEARARYLIAQSREQRESIQISLNIPKLLFSELLEESGRLHSHESQSTDLAYIIYTSGSTGKPKGTMITHRSVINCILGLGQAIYDHFSQPLRMSLVSPFEFDASIQHLFGGLLRGHSVHIVPDDVRVNGERLLAFYRQQRIEAADGTPTHLHLLNESMGGTGEGLYLKQVTIAGETLSPQIARRFLESFLENPPRLTNAYGPTETCVDSTYYHVYLEHIAELANLPIGQPLANQQIYIVNSYQRLQPIGLPGELYIAGEGLAEGYVSQPAITAEKFVPNPFALIGREQQRLYKTGDIARWLPDGTIEYLQRIDAQVKIRGMRIELGEIEQTLQTYPGIRQATVITSSQLPESGRRDEDTQIYAYIISDELLAESEIRSYLLQELPYYMVPSAIMRVEQLPLTSNGKIDRSALPIPIASTSDDMFLPRTATEEALVEIWCDILQRKAIGIQQNFFHLGGNSFQIISIESRIQRMLHVEIPIRSIFDCPTIETLAHHIDQLTSTSADDHQPLARIEPVMSQAHYPVSSAQQRLYFLNKLEESGTSYNIPGVLQIDGILERKRFEEAVQQLLTYHESLRTSFTFHEGAPVQIIHDQVVCICEYMEGNEEDSEQLIATFIRPFDLSQAPLFRVGLI